MIKRNLLLGLCVGLICTGGMVQATKEKLNGKAMKELFKCLEKSETLKSVQDAFVKAVEATGATEKVIANALGEDQQSPLYAVFGSTNPVGATKVEIAKFLVEKGADIGFKMDLTDRTLLHQAAFSGFTGGVCYLLEKGANIKAKDFEGNTPLHLACENKSAETTRALLELGAKAIVKEKNDDGNTPLHVACEYDKAENTKALLELGDKTIVEEKNEDGDTPLHVACEGGSLENVKILLDNGAKIDVQNTAGETPADIATNDEIKKLVIPKEAPEKGGVKKDVHQAARDGDLEALKAAFLAGATVEQQALDGSNWTSLQIACDKGHLAVVTFLVEEKGANIEATDTENRTSLHRACLEGRLETVKYLLEKGANTQAQALGGKTPSQLASDKGHVVVVKLLAEWPEQRKQKLNDALKAFSQSLEKLADKK